MRYSFDELKHRISIIEIAEHYGYKFQRGEGVRVPIYRHENGDKIGIFNPNDSYQQRYFSMRDDTDKGSLYNFVKHRLSNGTIPNPLSFPQCNNEGACISAVLHNYLNVPLGIREKNRENITFLQNRELNEKVDFEAQLIKLECKGFLYSRGIYERTIASQLFADRVFNLCGNVKTNIGFPIWSDGNMVGLEKRNRDMKKFFTGSDKSRGIWHSNIPKRITAIFVAETPLDCLAHRQLKGNDSMLYVSFGGNLCATQILTINKLLNANRERVDTRAFKFLLGADNDNSGTNYDLAFIRTQLSLQGNGSDQLVPNEMQRQRFIINYKDEESFKNAVRMAELVGENVKIETNVENKTIIVDHPNDMFAKRSICEAILKTHRLPYTVLEKAVMKDWNDDVMVLKEINKKGAKLTYKNFVENKEKYMQDCTIFEQKRLEQKKNTVK